MREYQAPVQDIRFILHEVLMLDTLLRYPAFSSISVEVIDAVLEGAAIFMNEKLAPLNRSGDKEGAKYKEAMVIMPTGFKEVYQEFSAQGWNSVPFDPAYGGQGLPWIVATAVGEMISGANMAFGLCPLLTQGAIETISHHGSKAQQETYLPKLIAGEWTGTMCLTEPQAGSDLGAITTAAIKKGEHYLIKGQKIFITYGEHDMAQNIIHMVLARVQGAPVGTKGISLFIVPKYLADGTRNDVKAISIEHKLGIHASPTCVMAFGEQDQCIGYLVGEEHQGLKYMFTMMNNARLAVGVEGVGVAENAVQQAEHYAMERVQMGMPIAKHPDITRTLLSMRSQVDAMRSLALFLAHGLDHAVSHKEASVRNHYAALVSFLVPVLKAHATNSGFEICSDAMQVFGGIGYTEEMGIAQCLRDIRITMIYEGTNGIQAQDLVMRKLVYDNGIAVLALIHEIEKILKNITPGSTAYHEQIMELWSHFIKATQTLQQLVSASPQHAQYKAVYYTKLCGIVLGAVMLNWQISVLDKSQILSKQEQQKKREVVDFYMRYVLPQAGYLFSIITS